jgi:hypothetical protein
VLTYDQIIVFLFLIAVIGGELLIYLIKRLLVSEKIGFSFDVSGMIERVLLIAAILGGGIFYYLIPVIILVRAFILAGEGTFKKIACIINREEPALEFQKIRLKSELTVDLLSSPAIGVIFGIIAKLTQ